MTVWVVNFVYSDVVDTVAVFTDEDKANAWADIQDSVNKRMRCEVVPVEVDAELVPNDAEDV